MSNGACEARGGYIFGAIPQDRSPAPTDPLSRSIPGFATLAWIRPIAGFLPHSASRLVVLALALQTIPSSALRVWSNGHNGNHIAAPPALQRVALLGN